MKTNKLSLGIVGGGPKSWIGHVHRISARFDDKYEIVAGVFSRNVNLSKKFGKVLSEFNPLRIARYLTRHSMLTLAIDVGDL